MNPHRAHFNRWLFYKLPGPGMMALEAMDVDAVTFGPFLKEARLERGMTQEQLAQRLHVSSAAVSKWERGKSLPDIAKVEELADALDLSVLELMRCQRQEQPLPKQELAGGLCPDAANGKASESAQDAEGGDCGGADGGVCCWRRTMFRWTICSACGR